MNLSQRVRGLFSSRPTVVEASEDDHDYSRSDTEPIAESDNEEASASRALVPVPRRSQSIRDCEDVIDSAYEQLSYRGREQLNVNRWPEESDLGLGEFSDDDGGNMNNSALPPRREDVLSPPPRYREEADRYEYRVRDDDSWSGPSVVTEPPHIARRRSTTVPRHVDAHDYSRSAQAGSQYRGSRSRASSHATPIRDLSPVSVISERSRHRGHGTDRERNHGADRERNYGRNRGRSLSPVERPDTRRSTYDGDSRRRTYAEVTRYGSARSPRRESTSRSRSTRYMLANSTLNGLPKLDDSVAAAVNILAQGKVKNFDGKNWNDFKAHFNWVKDLNSWDDKQALSVFVTKLSGAANTIVRQRPIWHWTYKEVIAALDLHFDSNKSEFIVKSKLKGIQQQPKESIQDFAMRIYEIAGGSFETQMQEDYELMDHFTYGLRDRKIAKKIVTKKPRIRTMYEALQLAKDKQDEGEWEHRETPSYRVHSNTLGGSTSTSTAPKTANTPTAADSELASSLTKIMDKIELLEKKVAAPRHSKANPFRFGRRDNEGNKGEQDPPREERPRRTRPPSHYRCYNCNEEGHYISACPRKAAEEGAGDAATRNA